MSADPTRSKAADRRQDPVALHRAAAAFVFAVASALWLHLRRSRETKALLELDERTLRDLGLSRSAVLLALGAPLPTNPSRLLSEWRRQRRGPSRSQPTMGDRR